MGEHREPEETEDHEAEGGEGADASLPATGERPASFAERRAMASELRREDLEALRAGRARPLYLVALWFVLSLLAIPVVGLLAVFGVWIFDARALLITVGIWAASFVALLLVARGLRHREHDTSHDPSADGGRR